MENGALITREAYTALLSLKSYVERAVEPARRAEFDTIGLALNPQPFGNPLEALKSASETLHSPSFDSAVS